MIPAPSSTFVPNQRLPVHRWFRYSAGFSGAWAEEVIRERTAPGSLVLDPFAGVATTLVAAQSAGRTSVGVEAHPFVLRVARAKLLWTRNPERFEKAAERLVTRASRMKARSASDEPSLLAASYTPYNLADLRRLGRALESEDEGDVRALLWLALVSILRACSRSGTAPWQYVLPKKRKARVAEPFVQFRAQVALMAEDMRGATVREARLLAGDARTCEGIEPGSVDLVLTSPPYPNNYDYADATRLEQTFLGEVRGWGDLHAVSRRFLVRACSQHTARDRSDLAALLADEAVAPIHAELLSVCARLSEIRETRGGKKTYHTMVAAYFADMARVFRTLSRVVRPGGEACFVVGDSAPYGVHVPVDRWLGALAEAAGWAFVDFHEVRKRNTKWKNRKHRVPLKEGHLWLVRHPT